MKLSDILAMARESKVNGGDINNVIELYKNALEISSSNQIKREYGDALIARGRDKDLKEAAELFITLADNGDTLAAGRAARFFRYGKGVPSDTDKAEYYYLIGIEHQWIKSELAQLYLENGRLNRLRCIPEIEKLFDKNNVTYINAECFMEDDTLRCILDDKNKNKFNILLYKDNVLIKKTSCDAQNIKFHIGSSGLYRLEGYSNDKRIKFNTFPICYFTDEDLNKFESFLKQDSCVKNEFNYYELNYPYCDFIIARGFAESFKGVDEWHTELITNDIYMCTNSKYLNKHILLSGYYHDGETVIYGNKDISDELNYKSIYNNVGCFTGVIKDADAVTVCNDYFGLNKLFYYHSNGIFAVSNRYHLLILILQKNGIKLEIDDEKIKFIMATSGSLLTDQLMDNDGLIKGTHILPLGKYFELKKTISIKSSGMMEFIESSEFSPESYSRYVKDAARELLDNMKGWFASKYFNRYLADLTGGGILDLYFHF